MRIHRFVLADIELVVVGDAAIVFQSLGPDGFIADGRHRDIADFE